MASVNTEIIPMSRHSKKPTEPSKLFTFKDLWTAEEKEKKEKDRMEKEKPLIIDAIVRAYNSSDDIEQIYEFDAPFSTFHYLTHQRMQMVWTRWLDEVCRLYPQLPRMKFGNGAWTANPYIIQCP